MKSQIVDALPALLRVLGEAGAYHLFQCWRRHRFDGADRFWFFLHDGGSDGKIGAAPEGALASDHLIEHGAEGEDVAAGIGLTPFNLLRRHVIAACPEPRLWQ